MKQLLILSGKGGTGKTTMASAFIRLSEAKVYADCDVDAPNLHLIRGKVLCNDDGKPVVPKKSDYFAMPKGFIDEKLCVGCGKCKEKCRFGAIENVKGKKSLQINQFACEGCGVCEFVCPEKAVSMKPVSAGELLLYENGKEVFSTAKLKIGAGTSGKLVAGVKKQMIDSQNKNMLESNVAIVDGSPGIGCPVISSLSGVDMVLIVAEPSMSGIIDMTRILKTASVFGTRAAVCVNKYNTNEERAGAIMEFCENHNIPFVGKVPFDNEAVKAINNGKSVVDVDCSAGRAIRQVYENTMNILFDN